MEPYVNGQCFWKSLSKGYSNPISLVNPQLLDSQDAGLACRTLGAKIEEAGERGDFKVILRWIFFGENLYRPCQVSKGKKIRHQWKEGWNSYGNLPNWKPQTQNHIQKIFDVFFPLSEASFCVDMIYRRDFCNLRRPLGIPSTSSSGKSGRTGTFSRGSMMGLWWETRKSSSLPLILMFTVLGMKKGSQHNLTPHDSGIWKTGKTTSLL